MFDSIPSIKEIPIVRSKEQYTITYDIVEPEHKWIEPEKQVAGWNEPWAYYRETTTSTSIVIQIDTLWGCKLHLQSIATPAYLGHDMQLNQSVDIINPKDYNQWVTVYYQLKELALEWLSYARVYTYRSTLLSHPDHYDIMARVSWLEYLKHSRCAGYEENITAAIIARWCGWFTTPHPCGGKEDIRRIMPHLESLVAQGYLLQEDETYKTPPQVCQRDWKKRNQFQRWEEFITTLQQEVEA